MIAIGPAGFGWAPRPQRRVSQLPESGDRAVCKRGRFRGRTIVVMAAWYSGLVTPMVSYEYEKPLVGEARDGDRVRPYTCRVRLTLERFRQRFAPVTP